MDPRDKVALITGGARIGQVVARALASRGCSLALTYRGSRDAAEATASEARAAGVKTAIFRADVTDESQVRAAVAEAAKSLGRLDILINMASAYMKTPNPTASDWSSALDSNAKSAFLFAIHAAPIMKKNGGGRIVNFGDWLPASGRPHYKHYTPYFASKAAVASFQNLVPVSVIRTWLPLTSILVSPEGSPAESFHRSSSSNFSRWASPRPAFSSCPSAR